MACSMLTAMSKGIFIYWFSIVVGKLNKGQSRSGVWNKNIANSFRCTDLLYSVNNGSRRSISIVCLQF